MIYTPSLIHPIGKRIEESASRTPLSSAVSSQGNPIVIPGVFAENSQCLRDNSQLDLTDRIHSMNPKSCSPVYDLNSPADLGSRYHRYGIFRPEGNASHDALFNCTPKFDAGQGKSRIIKQYSFPVSYSEENEIAALLDRKPLTKQSCNWRPRCATDSNCSFSLHGSSAQNDENEVSGITGSCPSLEMNVKEWHNIDDDAHFHVYIQALSNAAGPQGVSQINSEETKRLNERLLYFPRMHRRVCFQIKRQNENDQLEQNQRTLTDSSNSLLSLKNYVLSFLFGPSDQLNRLSYGGTQGTPMTTIPNNFLHHSMSKWGDGILREANSSVRKLRRLKLDQYRGADQSFKNGEKLSNASLSMTKNPEIESNPLQTLSAAGVARDQSCLICPGCRRVILNVSGLKFETWLSVLESRPSTLLGCSEKRERFWIDERKEYFFDRHRPSFEAIFNYYQYGGRIKRPAVVSDDVFLRELEFFQLEPEALELYKKNEGYIPEIVILPEEVWKRKLWLLFEYPETSIFALTISVASIAFTIISIILFCVETLPTYAQTHCEPGDLPNFIDPFFIIETICTFWFTMELIIRFISCPCKTSFVKDIKNLIDAAAICPYYITLFNVLISFSCEGAKNSASLAFLRVIRLIRVFKLTKHSSGLQVLVLTFKESIEGLGLFLVAFIVCILVFSSTIYYVEIDRKGSQIESIPDAFWWAVITMCTVGYGDKVPKGPLGKIVGSVCAVAGVLTLAIPVPIITENFNKFYAHKTGRSRR